MGRQYLKAVRLLPGELLEAVSKLLGGRPAYLWIPAGETIRREQRNAYIRRLSEEGCTAAVIADRLFISERTVWRVLRKARAVGQPSRVDVGRE